MYCLFCVVLYIVCVYMCTVTLPPGGYPIAGKYIISYHIILERKQVYPVMQYTKPTKVFHKVYEVYFKM